jgi:ParB family chromosome partitioning protein
MQNISLSKIEPNPYQPRKEMDGEENKIAELAESLKSSGLLQPIMVRPHNDGYQIATGERRFRAAKKAGFQEIPAIIREMDEKQLRMYSVIENIHRLDLNEDEKKVAFQKIWETDYGVKGNPEKGKSQMAEDLGLPSATLNRYLRAVEVEEIAEQKGVSLEGNLSVEELESIGRLIEQKPEAAKELIEARANGELSSIEFRDACRLALSAKDKHKTRIAKKIRKAGRRGKRAKEKGARHVKQAVKEVEDEQTGEVPKQQLKIILARDQKLLNRAIKFRSDAEKLDMTFLESFQTVELRNQAITNLEATASVLDGTLRGAHQSQDRWTKEWDECLNELKK